MGPRSDTSFQYSAELGSSRLCYAPTRNQKAVRYTPDNKEQLNTAWLKNVIKEKQNCFMCVFNPVKTQKTQFMRSENILRKKKSREDNSTLRIWRLWHGKQKYQRTHRV